MNRMSQHRLRCLSILICATALRALASDHTNLEEGLPVRVEDAYTLPFRAFEFQYASSYLNLSGAQQQYSFAPRVEMGFARNWQATVASTLLAGPSDRTGSGDTEVEVLHTFNTEGIRLPAFAGSVRMSFPTGTDSYGTDIRLKGILTKSVSNHSLQRIHLNAEYVHNAGRLADERKERYAVVLGYQAALSTSTMLVADVYREQQAIQHMDYNLAEIGVRRQLTPFTILAIGAGAGAGPNSPRFKITIGFQHDFGAR